MKLQQLKYLCAIVDEDFSITKAARKLHTSQPGVSKQLRLLEDELNATLLVRQRNRVIGLTDSAQAILPTARRILKEAETLKQILAEGADPKRGHLVIATTHVHARYTLTPILRTFRGRYPRVAVTLMQGKPREIAHWVSTGEADLGLGTPPAHLPPGLTTIPCFRMHHCLIVPPEHPLLGHKRLTLKTIARYPLVTTGANSRLGNLVAERFASRGLRPDVAMHAMDLEIIKQYVQAGFGVAIVPRVAVSGRADRGLRVIDISHIFEPSIASLVVQDDIPTRPYVEDFIDAVAPRKNNLRQIRDVGLAGDRRPRGGNPSYG